MASAAPPAAAQPVQAPTAAPDLYRFTVEQYHGMIEKGILTENDRVELLEGRIVCKMPHNPPHDGTIVRINRRLTRVLSEDWWVRVQCAIATPDSAPEPDLAIVRGPEEVYFTRQPTPQDVALLIEVADSTLARDRGEKRRLYARARISAYWIVNIPDAQVEVYTQPRAGRSPAYRQERIYRGDEVVPLILDGKEVAQFAVRDLLPPG